MDGGINGACARRRVDTGVLGIALAGTIASVGCGNVPSATREVIASKTGALGVAQNGLLRDGTMVPVAGAEIELTPVGGGQPAELASTDAYGSFVAKVSPGTYDVRVVPRDCFAPQTFPGQVISGNGTLSLVLAPFSLPAAPVPVSLRLVDPAGNPVPGAVCSFSTCTALADDGSVEVTATPDSLLSVEGAWSGGFGDVYIRAEDLGPTDGTPRFVSVPRYSLSGQIVDAGGAPVPGANISLPLCYRVDTGHLRGNFCPFGQVADANGRFQFTLPPGEVGLLVRGVGGHFRTIDVESDTDVTITLGPAVRLNGQVTDRDGTGLSTCRVCVSHPGCVSHFCQPLCTTTDGEGRYHLDVLGGDYDVTMRGQSATTGAFLAEGLISLNESQELNLPLPNRRFSGLLFTDSGASTRGIPISAGNYSVAIGSLTVSVDRVSQVTDTSGHFQFVLPAPGPVQLRFGNSGQSSETFFLTDDIDTPIFMHSPVVESRQLVDGNGQPLAGQRVCYWQEANSFCATTDGAGFYQLRLQPGTYQAVIQVTEDSQQLSTVTTKDLLVPSGSAPLDSVTTRPIVARLVDLNGDPIAGATVVSVCELAIRPDGQEQACDRTGQVTDASGGFLIKWLPGAGPALELQLPGTPDPIHLDVAVWPLDDLATLTVALQRI